MKIQDKLNDGAIPVFKNARQLITQKFEHIYSPEKIKEHLQKYPNPKEYRNIDKNDYLKEIVFVDMVNSGIEEGDMEFIKAYKDYKSQAIKYHIANIIYPKNNPYADSKYGDRLKINDINNADYMSEEEYDADMKIANGLLNALNKYEIPEGSVLYRAVSELFWTKYLLDAYEDFKVLQTNTFNTEMKPLITFVTNTPISTSLSEEGLEGFKSNIYLKLTTMPKQRGIIYNDVLSLNEVLLHPLTEVRVEKIYELSGRLIFEGYTVDSGEEL